VLGALDKAGFPVTVCLWNLRTDDEWELVIASPRFKHRGVYREIFDAMEGQLAPLDPPIRVESNRRPWIQALRKMFGKAASIRGMRLGLQTIGDTYIRDAYVYRIK
jgi:hypothetical protein